MKIKILLSFFLASFFLNCFGLDTGKKEDKNKDIIQNYLILGSLNTENLEINGTWKDNYDNTHQIFGFKDGFSNTYTGYWKDNFSDRTIKFFNNGEKKLIVKSPNEPGYADCNGNGTKGESGIPCYSRIVWTFYNGKYYYCEEIFNKSSFEEALNATPTNPTSSSNPDSSGCGTFAWTRFNEKLN